MSTNPASKWLPQNHVPKHLKEIFIENLSKPLSPTKNMLFVFHLIEALKYQKRTGWVDRGLEDCESISDHIFRVTFMSQFLKSPNLNISKCFSIALAHDIAEALVGDITPTDKTVDKHEKHYREKITIEYICDLIKPYNEEAAKKLLEDWNAYENVSCEEAVYVKDLDKYELLVQAFEYEKRHPELDVEEFWGALNMIKTDEVKQWAKDLVEEREQHRKNLKK
ncbi:hypothetical protein QEN19_000448 [Hanseniaspora menglaensis]